MVVPAGTQVADRIYYDDPGCTSFTAEVTAIREIARVDGKQVWQIALDRTAFCPTSGGQPFDTGVLTATARSGASLTVPITNVEEDESGEVWHTTAKPLQEGTAVSGAVDADRRRDHMQQHSGQHLLSAVLYRDFGARTISFHLGSETSTIDLEGATLTEQALEQAEQATNQVVGQALPISIQHVSQNEAEDMLAKGLLRKLPPRSGRIRLIEIPGLDLNACGGTHVANTAGIGPLLLRGTEQVRGGVRLAFVCGGRAIQAAHDDFQRLAGLARTLSTGVEEVPDRIARLLAESRSAAKERTALLRSLAEAEAVQLAAPATSSLVVHTLDPQQPGRDAAYAKLLASALVTNTPAKLALIAFPQGTESSVVLAAKRGSLDCGTSLRAALSDIGGRGGGSQEMAQGSLASDQLQSLLQKLQRELA
ncbi:MAG: alanyl-tRNA editing protein [Janthinobacterium lividum]